MNRRNARRAIVVAVAFAFSGSVAHADDASDMRETLRALTAKIDTLNAEQKRMQAKLDEAEKNASAAPAKQASSAPVVTAGDIPKSIKWPGTDTSFSIGGQVKAVAIRSSRGASTITGDEMLFPSAILLSDTANVRKNVWKAHAKNSRLIFRTHTPSSYGPVTTLIETDFSGAAGTETISNGHSMRIRHAWATIGNFAAGQYWSNAVNLTALPENVDQLPTIGLGGALRQTQFRWTHPLANGYASVSVENPESLIVLDRTNNGAATRPDNDKALDLTGKYHFAAVGGQWELTGALRKITSAETAAGRENMTGGGLSFSGYLPVFGKDRLMLGFAHASGSGRWIGGLAPDAVEIGGSLKRIDTNSGYVAYRHYWTPSLRSNLNYSWISISNPSDVSARTAAGLDKKIWTAHLNTIWQVTPNAELGLEYLRAIREVESGASGTLNRLQFMALYKF